VEPCVRVQPDAQAPAAPTENIAQVNAEPFSSDQRRGPSELGSGSGGTTARNTVDSSAAQTSGGGTGGNAGTPSVAARGRRTVGGNADCSGTTRDSDGSVTSARVSPEGLALDSETRGHPEHSTDLNQVRAGRNTSPPRGASRHGKLSLKVQATDGIPGRQLPGTPGSPDQWNARTTLVDMPERGSDATSRRSH
jgi:hypothetical protein